MMDFNDGYHMSGYGLQAGFFGIVMIGIIVAVVILIRKSQPPRPTTTLPAIELLKQRYVKGELTQAEFESMKRDITEHS